MSTASHASKSKGTSEKQRQLVEKMSLQFKVLLEGRESIIKAYQGNEQSMHLADFYECSITTLLETFLELGSLIALRQAGGRPIHGHVGIALILQERLYAAEGSFYTAKKLAKAIKDYAANQTKLDTEWEQLTFKHGKRTAKQAPMSERIAGQCIQAYKAFVIGR